MRCLFVYPWLRANRYGFHSCAILMIMMILLLTTSAHAQMWAGPIVGYESIQRSEGSRNGAGRGVELGLRIARQQRIDLFLAGYVTGLRVGNDADPPHYLAIGARWRIPAMDPIHPHLPFFSLGLGTGLGRYWSPIIGYIQGEAGIELFAQDPVGIELSIRDKIFAASGITNSVQAALLLRFGRLNPRHQ